MKNYPISIGPYLEEIAECIWNKNASIMVGAGFSMNTDKKGGSSKKSPSWQDLGNKFYKKVRGEEIGKSGLNFFDPLKLAYEVEANFGRSVLDNMLRDSIPDLEHKPSELHYLLLNFPWVDVFTTNYDTLLDRAAETSTYNYKVVVNQSDLIHSNSPRIIKLHGCFRASTPLIISEEDYRTYPYKYAPFVNTVQQTLLENTLCLIGFSGDDPNFLKWIGWIRDNLGKDNSPKIYLLGALGLSSSQEKTLSQYNITCVDMSLCADVGEKEHYKAIRSFFEYVGSKKKEIPDWNKKEASDWNIEENSDKDKKKDANWNKKEDVFSGKSKKFSEVINTSISPKIANNSENSKAKTEELEKIIKEWRVARENYPNWLIVPEKIRAKLEQRTLYWQRYVTNLSSISNILKLEFIYEYLWRKEKCLLPIWDNEIEVVVDLIKHYINEINKIGSIEYIDGISAESLVDKIGFLLLALCRYYREENKLNERTEFYTLAENFLSDTKYTNELSNEKVWQYAFDGDEKGLKQHLSIWAVKESTAYWMYKKAGFLAKVNMQEESKTLLNEALVKIRKQINEVTIIDEYSHLSLESYVLLLLNYIENSTDYKRDKNEETQSRLDFLKQYNCDPYGEIAYLENSISHECIINNNKKNKEFGFDIGIYSESWNADINYSEVSKGFHLLRFFEDTGIPYQINSRTLGSKGAENAIKRIADFAPNWAMFTMLQLGNTNSMKGFFTRKRLNTMDVSLINEIAQKYILRLSELFDTDESDNRIGHILPEALSRLCCKCSIEVKEAILKLIKRIYAGSQTHSFYEIKNLLRRLIESCDKNFLIKHANDFLHISYLYSKNINNRRFITVFGNPFHSESLSLAFKGEKIKLTKSIISSALKLAKSKDKNEKESSLFTLVSLSNMGLLNKNEEKILNTTLLAHKDDYGFPIGTNYFKSAFNDVLIDQEKYQENLKKYILETNHEIQNQKTKPTSYTMTNTFDELCNEIILASKFIEWNEKEQNIIYNKLMVWWDADKKYLLNDSRNNGFPSMKDEFKKRFSLFPSVLSCLSIKETLIKREAINSLVDDFKVHGLPYIYLYTVIFYSSNKSETIIKISNVLAVEEDDVLRDAFKAIFYCIKEDGTLCGDLLNNVFQYIKYTKTDNLHYGLEVLKELIESDNIALDGIYLDIVANVLIKISKGFSDLNFDENLSLQKSAANIAYLSSIHLKTNNHLIKQALLIWKERCLSENEFAEIKNQWLIQ